MNELKPAGGGFMLVPPAPDVCQVCATKHEPSMPHNQQSLYYQMAFRGEHGRWPTWTDAMAHCTFSMQRYWVDELRKRGVDVPEPAAAAEKPEAKS